MSSTRLPGLSLVDVSAYAAKFPCCSSRLNVSILLYRPIPELLTLLLFDDIFDFEQPMRAAA
jgi:hypothetical protein